MTCVHLSMASKATSEQDLLLISQRSATCIMFFQRQNNLAAHVTSPRANCGRRDYAPLWLLIQHGVDALHMGNVQLIVNNGLNVLHWRTKSWRLDCLITLRSELLRRLRCQPQRRRVLNYCGIGKMHMYRGSCIDMIGLACCLIVPITDTEINITKKLGRVLPP